MVNEFPEIYNELFENSIKRLMKELKIKQDAILQCESAAQGSRGNAYTNSVDELIRIKSNPTNLY